MNTELLRVILSYTFAILLVVVCFLFLYLAFLDPNTFGLPEEQQNVIVAGIFGLLGSATTYVFTTSSASNAARQAERASAAGANAALSTPPAPTLPTPPDSTETAPTETAPPPIVPPEG